MKSYSLNKIFVDTNIFVYLFTDININKKNKCKKLIENIIKNKNIELTISIQTIIEFINVTYKKIKTNSYGNIQAIYFFEKNFTILYYNTNTIIEAIKIELKYNIYFFDALIIATMLENNITTIYSENEKDFKKIKELKVINPFK
jgi:predicted nucleic acid-binding protein